VFSRWSSRVTRSSSSPTFVCVGDQDRAGRSSRMIKDTTVSFGSRSSPTSSGRSHLAIRTALRELGLTFEPGLGFTKADCEWSRKLSAVLTATRPDHLKHGTNAPYVRGCVCSECQRMAAQAECPESQQAAMSQTPAAVHYDARARASGTGCLPGRTGDCEVPPSPSSE